MIFLLKSLLETLALFGKLAVIIPVLTLAGCGLFLFPLALTLVSVKHLACAAVLLVACRLIASSLRLVLANR